MKAMKNRVSGVAYRVSPKANGVRDAAGQVMTAPAQAPRPATTLEYDHEIGCYRWSVKGKA